MLQEGISCTVFMADVTTSEHVSELIFEIMQAAATNLR